eukprot:scaffold1057_cov459-Prasinococcus_capsulatus_cf.AAC.9
MDSGTRQAALRLHARPLATRSFERDSRGGRIRGLSVLGRGSALSRRSGRLCHLLPQVLKHLKPLLCAEQGKIRPGTLGRICISTSELVCLTVPYVYLWIGSCSGTILADASHNDPGDGSFEAF